MISYSKISKQVNEVVSFNDLVSIPFESNINAMCWNRQLKGNFYEIVNQLELTGNITEINENELLNLQLSKEGQLAREILLNDLLLLQSQGAAPVLNVIKYYDRDDTFPFFPTDVYSFHVDRSPVPTDTFLCTYHGEPSEILPNSQGIQKVIIPEIREELIKLHNGNAEDFESFLVDNFFDLHYQAHPEAQPINLGLGHMWKIAIDHPESKVLPCLHRAPEEKDGQLRLLMIC